MIRKWTQAQIDNELASQGFVKDFDLPARVKPSADIDLTNDLKGINTAMLPVKNPKSDE